MKKLNNLFCVGGFALSIFLIMKSAETNSSTLLITGILVLLSTVDMFE